MSTRSIVARPDGEGWVGRYCHWDGYPTCRGAQLWLTYKELGNAEAVRQYAIRPEENGYWSSYATPSELAKVEGSWVEEPSISPSLVGSSGDHCGTEWAYVIGDEGLSVFAWLYEEGRWEPCGAYPWSGPEPDWERIQKDVYEAVRS